MAWLMNNTLLLAEIKGSSELNQLGKIGMMFLHISPAWVDLLSTLEARESLWWRLLRILLLAELRCSRWSLLLFVSVLKSSMQYLD